MTDDLNSILTLASVLVSSVVALITILGAWRAAKRDRFASKEYNIKVGNLMIELRREYADRLKSQKNDNLSSQR